MSPLLSIWVLTPRVPFNENNKIIIPRSIFTVNEKRKSFVNKAVLQDIKQMNVPGLRRPPQFAFYLGAKPSWREIFPRRCGLLRPIVKGACGRLLEGCAGSAFVEKCGEKMDSFMVNSLTATRVKQKISYERFYRKLSTSERVSEFSKSY